MDKITMVDNRQILEDASALRKQSQYDQAILLFEPIWLESKSTMTYWDCWNYAFCLKKLGQVQTALTICRHTYLVKSDFRRNNDLYAWCIYELEVKGRHPELESSEKQEQFQKAVNAIVKLSEQDLYSPYEHTIMAYLRYLSKKQNSPFDLVIEWSDKLSPNQLSTKCLTYEDETGASREQASYQELWYAYRTKALEKLERYSECLLLSKQALDVLTEFHYSNDIWFRWRIGISLHHLGQIQEAIDALKQVLKFKQEWFVQMSLAEAYCDITDYESSLQYAVDAALGGRDYEKKYKLFLLLADLFEAKNEIDLARKHVGLAAALYHQYEAKRIKSKLALAMKKYDISSTPLLTADELYKELKPVWQEIKFANLPKQVGMIDKILPSGKDGFIKAEDGKSHYFLVKSFQGNKRLLQKALPVSFYIKPSYDHRKQQDSTEAIHIVPMP